MHWHHVVSFTTTLDSYPFQRGLVRTKRNGSVFFQLTHVGLGNGCMFKLVVKDIIVSRHDWAWIGRNQPEFYSPRGVYILHVCLNQHPFYFFIRKSTFVVGMKITTLDRVNPDTKGSRKSRLTQFHALAWRSRAPPSRFTSFLEHSIPRGHLG